MEKFESAATKRARERKYYESDSKWFANFVAKDLKGDLGYEEGVHRRDPSSVLLVDGKYYVWYTKSVGEVQGHVEGQPDLKVWPWDYSDIWYAESEDGHTWKELGCAVGRGEKGAYDDRSVFTPEILRHEGKFYLTYQVVQSPYVVRVLEHIAMAVADNVHGPFVKLDAPIVYAENDGEWEGDADDRFAVKKKSSFDGHKVHDPSLHYFQGKFFLYYKGEAMGEELYGCGREIKWGVAIADNITGPYVKSPYNPISNSGHETCLWEYEGGMAAMLTSDGFEKNTFQYAKDGINFEIMGTLLRLEAPPHAMGPFRPENPDFKMPMDGVKWGLQMVGGTMGKWVKWNYIQRIECVQLKKR